LILLKIRSRQERKKEKTNEGRKWHWERSERQMNRQRSMRIRKMNNKISLGN
jgi:hypothetical protein